MRYFQWEFQQLFHVLTKRVTNFNNIICKFELFSRSKKYLPFSAAKWRGVTPKTSFWFTFELFSIRICMIFTWPEKKLKLIYFWYKKKLKIYPWMQPYAMEFYCEHPNESHQHHFRSKFEQYSDNLSENLYDLLLIRV